MSESLLPEINATRMPVVSIQDGKVFANSRNVAAFFGKQHGHITRDIESLIRRKPQMGVSNFGETPYVDPQNGQTYKSYDMDRTGFTVLAMGFTGDKALDFKLRYIEQFDAMEASLKTAAGMIDLGNPDHLLPLLTQYAQANQKLLAEAAAAKPKTAFFDSFVNADGLYGLQQAGRVLGQQPNKFVGMLKQGYLFYQGGALVPKVQYREMGIFEVKVTIVDNKARPQTYVTPKGIQYFAKKLGVGAPGEEAA